MTPTAIVAAPEFAHLTRLTDQYGLFEHARLDEPRTEHGYCVDDVARALVVVSREARPDDRLRRLRRLYLGFVLDAVADDGACRNRMNRRGTWTDQPSVGDWWGRAAWGLGTASAQGGTAGERARALNGFRLLAQRRSPDSRATAFAALGATAVLRARPEEVAASALLADCADALMNLSSDVRWVWPEPRLRYANAAVAEALIAAGEALAERDLLDRGLELLAFLVARQTRNGHLSVTPAAGQKWDDADAGFDQQPIEVAALADAAWTAYTATKDPSWLTAVDRAWRWFLGDNDTGVEMFDQRTGAGYDGLERNGRNENQGAESTLAMLSTAQRAYAVHALR